MNNNDFLNFDAAFFSAKSRGGRGVCNYCERLPEKMKKSGNNWVAYCAICYNRLSKNKCSLSGWQKDILNKLIGGLVLIHVDTIQGQFFTLADSIKGGPTDRCWPYPKKTTINSLKRRGLVAPVEGKNGRIDHVTTLWHLTDEGAAVASSLGLEGFKSDPPWPKVGQCANCLFGYCVKCGSCKCKNINKINPCACNNHIKILAKFIDANKERESPFDNFTLFVDEDEIAKLAALEVGQTWARSSFGNGTFNIIYKRLS